MAEQHLRRKTLSSNSNYFQSDNKNPLHSRKDGRQRMGSYESSSSTMNSGSHHRKPLENNVAYYFPDHVARVSYIASVVKPEASGDYLNDLQGGMKVLATRLAPSYFPGTVVRQITTQVDGYFPSACPSTKFNNCQDVTASVGIYLSAVPAMENVGGRTSTSSENKEGRVQVDPSAMTEELLAFQKSLSAAIANNELQDAIRQEYLRKDYSSDIIPAVVIVTETVDKSNFGAGDSFGTTTIGVSVGDPTVSNPAIAAVGSSDTSTKNVGLATVGVTGTALFSVLLILWLARGRGRGSDTRREEEVLVDVKEKIKRHHRNRHSKTRKDDDWDPSKQGQLEIGDEEEGFTGTTMHTVASDSAHTSSSRETLLQLVASGLTLADDDNPDGSASSRESQKSFQHITSSVNNLIPTDPVFGDDFIDRSNIVEQLEESADDDDDNGNDFVLGEDDDSIGSVRQHLLSVSRSSDCPIPSESPQAIDVPAPLANDFSSEETAEETTDINSSPLIQQDLQESSQVPSSNASPEGISAFSELDAAIANNDWATVGAAAAVFASEAKTPLYKRTKLRPSSPYSEKTLEFSQKEEELDKLIETGDWQGVVKTAAKFDAADVSFEGGTAEEDVHHSKTIPRGSDRSKASTQGSDANDSCASIMDNSSEGRSYSRSVGTTASQKERVEEIRSQVMELVRDVVPDEEQNVDEMIRQFKGREEELLETLLSMKEKMVAKKARIESRKTAKRNTKERNESEEFEASTARVAGNQLSGASEIETDDGSGREGQQNMNSPSEKDGCFDNSARMDHDKAASDAAAWAIQRSLDEMMGKERNMSQPGPE